MEWQTAPGVYSRDISSQQLQALQATELRVIDSAPAISRSIPHGGVRTPTSSHRRQVSPPIGDADASQSE